MIIFSVANLVPPTSGSDSSLMLILSLTLSGCQVMSSFLEPSRAVLSDNSKASGSKVRHHLPFGPLKRLRK